MKKQILSFALTLSLSSALQGLELTPSEETPPTVPREFRAAWIATVWNINWPTKGAPPEKQQAELLAYFDRAQALNMNAIVLQVRSSCDALFESAEEPWSENLTGKMGKAPSPKWDPLEFAVREAHKRGLELHAWFNPFRARVTDTVVVSENHISKRRPELVREYGKFLWLDPGEPEARKYSIDVTLDVVKRYDIDGVHIDDYFYPYPIRDEKGKLVDFPDERSWTAYQESGGKLSRGDWRRENVDEYVHKLHVGIKDTKSWVKFGISPFGIWRPGFPAQIKGFDPHESIYADAKVWLINGWCDYFAPQIYWRIEPPAQSFPVLLKWWEEQNVLGRHIWPGLNTVKTAEWGVEEIPKQVRLTREITPRSPGHIHYHIKPLMNPKGLSEGLVSLYDQPALIPASPWLGAREPGKPHIASRDNSQAAKIVWRPSRGEDVRQWVLQLKRNGIWTTRILPENERSWKLESNDRPEVIAVTGVSRSGVAGKPAVVALN